MSNSSKGGVGRRVAAAVPGVIVLAAAIGLYELLARMAGSAFFPAVGSIAVTFWRTWTSSAIQEQLLPSLWRMLVGYLIACVLGAALGLLLGRARRVERTINPFLQFLRAIPPPAIVPIALLVLGVNPSMQVLVIVFGAVWPILLNSADGARGVPAEQLDTAANFGLGRWQVTWRVVLPSALPQIFAGMRIGLGLALIMMIVSELTASTNGLGYFILTAQRTYEIPEMYAGIVLLGILGLLLNRLFIAVERRLLGRRFDEKAGVV
ncbi:ABC transporter permease [Saccharopolyspora sp. K220]|uniref:ABC transporter permease n=1 Tax=Saccharopolyspora soli TaxID=2926618 RepID=UPI001F568624|nr:ABC transporter permease [Saccharopolyspora soli]MCI2423766.1 ABC transporter permease [Saccharopolyspora soli]